MSYFYRERPVAKTRKERQCASCEKVIPAGSAALDCSGYGADGFWAAKYHTDCRAAECEYNKIIQSGYDEWVTLWELEEYDDKKWLLENYPEVAARLRITAEGLAEVEAEMKLAALPFAARARIPAEGEGQ